MKNKFNLTRLAIFAVGFLLQSEVQAMVEWNKVESSVMIQTKKKSGTFICSGVLISPFFVLTAAHCVDGALSNSVIFGMAFKAPKTTWITVKQESVVMHPDYNLKKSKFNSDLAILKLDEAADLTVFPKFPILHPTPKDTLYLIGFGLRNKENRRTMTTTTVVRIDPKTLVLKNSMSVLGDSGGPLYSIDDKGNCSVIGIHSTVLDGEHSAAVDLMQFTPWIIKTEEALGK